MDYYSKAGYSLGFKKREIIWFFIGTIAIILLILIFFPTPANYYIALVAFFIILLMFIAYIVLIKAVLGVIVKIEGRNIKIYKAASFTLRPEKNQILFTFGGKSFHASCNLTRNNINSIRKIENSEEIRQIKDINNVFSVFRVSKIGIPLNKSSMEKISFVSNYDNIIEIGLKNIQIKYPSIFGKMENSMFGNKVYSLKNTKIFVSVKNPEEFIKIIKI